MLLNKAVVNTSNNYGINHISLNDELIKDNISSFNNITSNNLIIKGNDGIVNIKYGLNDYLTNQANNNSNYKKNINIKEDGVLSFTFDSENNTLVENLNITIKENTDVKLLIKYDSVDNKDYYHNGLIKINLEKNSKARIIIVNLLNNNSCNLLSIDNCIEKEAQLDFGIFTFGSKNNVINYYSCLNADNSISNLNSIYLRGENTLTDLNYIIDLYGKNTNANMFVEGALTNNAKKSFKGTLSFKKGSSSSFASESENTCLLSDEAISKSLPMMLCKEEKVMGNHSTSTFKIDNNKLYYIMSRGLSEQEAKVLIIKSKFEKALNMINDEELRIKIEKIIDEGVNIYE